MTGIAPVAFFVFNRTGPTASVFNAIRNARPETLLLIADGPRQQKDNESILCNEVRNIVETIDWPCRVYKNFCDENLGCRQRVSSGLDWVFSLVDRAIILEDDCLPEPSFFNFCSELLEHYKEDERVMQICGSNFLNGWRRADDSYYFSSFGPIWGWASWRRAWAYYDVDLTLWPEIRDRQVYYDFCLDKKEADFRIDLYDRLYRGDLDTWDYQWGFAKMINSGLSITPNENLISNIGFGKDATHTSGELPSPFENMHVSTMEFPLKHPKYVLRDKQSDQKYLEQFVYKGCAVEDDTCDASILSKLTRLIKGNR